MSAKAEENKIPEEFPKIIKDFVGDIKTTFPEFKDLIEKWWKDESFFNYIEDIEERNKTYFEAEKQTIKFLFDFCQKKFPARFFEILYQNEDMFKDDSNLDTEFLPHIHFKTLWKLDISQKTRETIWKYLQLILFCIIGTIENREAFGDTAKLFEAINADDFKDKLQETLSQMQDLFNMPGLSGDDECPELTPNINMDNLPKAEDINAHISGLLNGKLGQLAKEIAEETAADLNLDLEGVTDMKDVFNKLIKNPSKLMNLVKDVGGKLDSRIKSGEIKESELMEEASELMNKMKNMPGMGNIQSMLSKMGMGNLGGKMNMGAMQSQLNKNMKGAQMRERMKAKAEANQKMKAQTPVAPPIPVTPALTEEQLISIFSTGEKVERTPRGAKPTTNNNNNKKKKGKK
uniref:Uncharacterized protein n=1 Tax=viral metagenome TaxID=1070528 RepID=A0A6C0IES3_9ZZZZ